MSTQTMSKGHKTKLSTRELTVAALFVALVAVGAFIRIPVPNLPFTLQLLFTTLAGLILGSRLGSMSVFLYVILGLIGVPVFTEGGGPYYVFQPTFGYLIGFGLGAFAAGKIIETSESRSISRYLIASFVNLLIVYAVGMLYLYNITAFYIGKPIGMEALLIYCFALPAIPDVFLCIIASYVAKRMLKVMRFY